MKWDELASDARIQTTVKSLKENGIDAIVVENGEEANKKVLEMLPKGADVMTMSSMTIDSIGLSKKINESGNFSSVRNKLMSMNRNTQGREMNKLGATPEWTVGSVHAVTEDGHVLIASYTGSQLSAYVYGAGHVVWVVGTQKIVKNLDEGIKRIYEYTLPLEDARAKKVYGMGSAVNKLLIVNKEASQRRITMIFVKEKLGF